MNDLLSERIRQWAEMEEGRSETQVTEYCKDAESIRAFARILVDADIIPDMHILFDYWEKPWHWSREYDLWVENNKPHKPYYPEFYNSDYEYEENIRNWSRFIDDVDDMYEKDREFVF